MRTIGRRLGTLASATVLLGGLAAVLGAGPASASTGGGCGGQQWKEACISEQSDGVYSDAYTNFSVGNCQLDVVLWDVTTNFRWDHSYNCGSGSQHYLGEQLHDPSQGHDYRTDLVVSWYDGYGNTTQTETVTGPDLWADAVGQSAPPPPAKAPCLANPGGNESDTIQICGKCLDVLNAGTADFTPVQIVDCDGSPAQRWVTVFKQPFNSYTALMNPNSGKCLDIPNDNATPGQQLQIYTCNGNPSQEWDSGGDPSGVYFAEVVKNRPSGLVLDVPNGDFRVGARPQLWMENDSPSQEWTDYYKHYYGGGSLCTPVPIGGTEEDPVEACRDDR